MHDLSIAKPHQLFSLIIFLGVALMIGDLAGRLRDQVARSRNQAKNTQALYEFSRKLSGTARLDDVLFSTATHLHSTFGTGVAILMPDDGELSLQTAWPPDLTLDGTDMTAVRWAFEKNERAGSRYGDIAADRMAVSAHSHFAWRGGRPGPVHAGSSRL